MDLRPRVRPVGVGVAFLWGFVGGGFGLVGEFAEGPAGEEGCEDFAGRGRFGLCGGRGVVGGVIVVVVMRWCNSRRGLPRHSFQDPVRIAVDPALVDFIIGPVADAEVRRARPLSVGAGVGGGVGCDGGGGAVGDELRVGGDVGYYVVDVFGGVGENAGGCEGLEGGEGVGEAAPLGEGEGGEVLWWV